MTNVVPPDRDGASPSVISLAEYVAGRAESENASDTQPDALTVVDAQDAEDQLLRRLGRAPLSERESLSFLRERGLDDDQIIDIVGRAIDHKYIDDVSLAEQLVHKLRDRKGQSRSAMARELSTRGIERSVIDEAVSVIDEDDEKDAARAVAERRAAQFQHLDRAVAERRLTAFLVRRGYPGTMVRELVAEALPKASAVRFR